MTPHAPQFWPSLATGMHMPLQYAWYGGQAHWPMLRHTWPPGHIELLEQGVPLPVRPVPPTPPPPPPPPVPPPPVLRSSPPPTPMSMPLLPLLEWQPAKAR